MVLDLGPLKVIKLSFSLIGQAVDALQSEEIAAAFLGALFDVVHGTIVDARRGRNPVQAKKCFEAAWGIPDITCPEDSPRYRNFVKVQDKAISLLADQVDNISAKRAFRTVSTKPSPQIPQGEQQSSGNELEISATNLVAISNPAAKMEATRGTKDPGGESESYLLSASVSYRFRYRPMARGAVHHLHPAIRRSAKAGSH